MKDEVFDFGGEGDEDGKSQQVTKTTAKHFLDTTSDEKEAPGNEGLELLDVLMCEFNLVSFAPEKYVIANNLVKWRRTGNPFYVDRALILANKHGLVTTSVVAEAVACAESRLNAKKNGKGLPGTDNQIKAEEERSWCLSLMLNIRFHKECTQEKAAELAASAFAKYFPAKNHYKASTLWRWYSDVYMPDGEKAFFKAWRRHREKANEKEQAYYENQSAVWNGFIDSIPPCPDDLKGSRKT